MSQLAGPVLVLGAGATKACGGPLTNDSLFEADQAVTGIEREGYLALLDGFLEQVFRLPQRNSRVKTSYPGLPLLMSLIDAAIDRGQPLRSGYDAAKLRDVRAALDYTIFAVLEFKLRGVIPPFHRQAADILFPASEPQIVSLNYDIIADNVLAARTASTFPDYCCDIRTKTYPILVSRQPVQGLRYFCAPGDDHTHAKKGLSQSPHRAGLVQGGGVAALRFGSGLRRLQHALRRCRSGVPV
jgi:hypothetical protein